MVKLFFKALRLILGPFLLLWEYVSRPRGILRSAADQAIVDRDCHNLTLYQFNTCPFCIKVRQEMRRLSLSIGRLDAQHDECHRKELLVGGGVVKVPCLRIIEETGSERWLYESDRIIGYLRDRYAKGEME